MLSFWRVVLGVSRERRMLVGPLARDTTRRMRRLNGAGEPAVADAPIGRYPRDYRRPDPASVRCAPFCTVRAQRAAVADVEERAVLGVDAEPSDRYRVVRQPDGWS